MKKLVSLKNNILPYLLTESQNNEDLTIICKNGKYCCNAFLFASIFPGLSPVLECLLFQEEAPSVSIPDVSVMDLVEFFNSVYQKDSKLKANNSVQGLLQWTKLNIRPIKEKFEYVPELIKNEIDDYGQDNDMDDFMFGNDIDVDSGNNSQSKEEDIVQLKFAKKKIKKKRLVSETDEDGDSDWSEPQEVKRKKKSVSGHLKSDLKSRKIRKYTVKNKGKICPMRFEYDELKCFTCNLTFTNENGLWSHVFRKHGPHQQQTCKDCDQVFENPGQYESHRTRFHGRKEPCPECGKLFKKGSLNIHLRSYHRKEDFTCHECGKQFATDTYLKTHIETKHKGMKKGLSTTNKLSSKNPGELAAECDAVCKCDIKFSSMKEKIDHYRVVHLGHAQCPKCLKILKKERIENNSHMCEPGGVKKKYKRKKPDKPLVCDKGCNETFNSYGALWYHNKKTHEAENVSCELCGKVFITYIHLKEHIKDTHKEKVGNVFKYYCQILNVFLQTPCQICGAVVRQMELHIATAHTDDSMKKYQCQYCGKGFTERQKLDRHVMSIHLKLKPYNCRFGCDIAYNDYSNRNQHEKKKHGSLFTEIST